MANSKELTEQVMELHKKQTEEMKALEEQREEALKVEKYDEAAVELHNKLKNVNGRVNALLRTGKDFVKNNLSVSAAQHIIDTGKLVESDNPDYPICIDNQWYFEGVEVKKTAKKAQLSSMYGEMKEGK